MHRGGCQTIYHFNKEEAVLGPWPHCHLQRPNSVWAGYCTSSLVSPNAVRIIRQCLMSRCTFPQHIIFALRMSFKDIHNKLFAYHSRHKFHKEKNVRWCSVKSETHGGGWGGRWVRHTQDFHPGDRGLCPVWSQKSVFTYVCKLTKVTYLM